jgi:chromosome partitioning protein
MSKPSIKKKSGVVVSVLNMKGGVGKTTISAHVFRYLFRHLQKSTLLIDFDPQFNLTQTILPQNEYEVLKSKKKTIYSIMEDLSAPSLFKTNNQSANPPSCAEVTHTIRHFTHEKSINLSLLAGDFDLAKYTLINNDNVLSSARKRFQKFIEETKLEKDVICIDCNPSSSFITTCALKASTHVLVPIRPDRYSLLGLKLLNEFIQSIPEINPKPKLIIMLNGIEANGYDPTVENSLRSDPTFGPLTMAATLKRSKLLEASQSYTGFATDKKQSWRITPQITTIVDELKVKLGLA